jgi:hypothetical protein
MANPNTLPHLPDIVPHKVTQDKIKLAHAPPSFPIHADDTPIANCFGDLRGLSQNKCIPGPRETTGLTPVREKHGAPICHASYLKAQSVIQEQLAKWLSSLLHVLNSVTEGDDGLCDQPIVSLNGDAATNLNVDATSSNDDDYNLMPEYLIPPSQRWHKK